MAVTLPYSFDTSNIWKVFAEAAQEFPGQDSGTPGIQIVVVLDSREGAGPFHFLLGAFTVFFSDKMNRRTVAACKHRTPDDLVFCTRKGGPLGKRNLLRHIKVAATKLGLSKSVDSRSFRTMHSSLMLREGFKAGGRPRQYGPL